jgi:predicted flap endonuclease-1-like 5' DNA nuclease
MAKIADIEGIGPKFGDKLSAAGIKTTEALLKHAANKKGRQDLAAKTGLDTGKLLEWVNRADLMRIKGVGTQYSDLLEAAGVDTVPELAQRNAKNLFAKLQEVNGQKKLVRQLPTAEQVEKWVKAAKALKRMVDY